jgi:integrase
MSSPEFRGLAPATQQNYSRALYRAESPEMLGAIGVGMLRPSIIQAYLDGMASRPGNAQVARTALKRVESWAVIRDLLPHPVMTGTYTARSKGGRKPWPDEQIALAERHVRADLARVVTLMANTGQRGSDVVKMSRSDFRTHEGHPGINVKQKKTGLEIWIPFTRELIAVIETWEVRPGYLVLQRNGKPFTRERLSVYWDDERATNPALAPLLEAGCTLHGLRATAVVRLRRAGANAQQIADMVGMSVPMVERYCRFANQKDNALAAVHYLDRTRTEQARLKSREPG